MKLTSWALLLVLGALPVLAQNAGHSTAETQIQQNENAAWEAWKNHDTAAFDKILTDDAINIAGGSIEYGKAEIMKNLSAPCKVNSFALSDIKYQWINDNAVIMTYSATEDGACGDQKLSPKIIASSLWVNRDGKWMSPFHQESDAVSH